MAALVNHTKFGWDLGTGKYLIFIYQTWYQIGIEMVYLRSSMSYLRYVLIITYVLSSFFNLKFDS